MVCERFEDCEQGLCELICPDDQLACDAHCVTPSSNPQHCGTCDQTCEATLFCSGGECITPCRPDETLCGRACADVDQHRGIRCCSDAL